MIRAAIIIFLLIFSLISVCSAQTNIEKFIPSFSLRTNLLSFAEIDGGIMLGARYQWAKKISVTIDPTLIFFSPYRSQNSADLKTSGIKIRADIRYHFEKFLLNLPGVFIAPEFHFKKAGIGKTTTFGINCVGQTCNYYMEAEYKEIKNEIGGSLKLGIDLPLDKKERFSFEIYGGLGVKVNHYTYKSIPAGGSFLSGENIHQDFFNIADGKAIPILPASIKLCYQIR